MRPWKCFNPVTLETPWPSEGGSQGLLLMMQITEIKCLKLGRGGASRGLVSH